MTDLRRASLLSTLFVSLALVAGAANAGNPDLERINRLKMRPPSREVLDALKALRRVQRPKRRERVRMRYRVWLAAGALLREAPSSGASVVYRMKKRGGATAKAQSGDWVYVRRRLWRGWVAKKDVKARRRRISWRAWLARRQVVRFDQAIEAKTRGRAALVRSPRKRGKRNLVAKLTKDTTVRIVASVGRYLEVTTGDGKKGYLHRREVRATAAARKAASERLRKGKGKSSPKAEKGRRGRKERLKKRGVGKKARKKGGKSKDKRARRDRRRSGRAAKGTKRSTAKRRPASRRTRRGGGTTKRRSSSRAKSLGKRSRAWTRKAGGASKSRGGARRGALGRGRSVGTSGRRTRSPSVKRSYPATTGSKSVRRGRKQARPRESASRASVKRGRARSSTIPRTRTRPTGKRGRSATAKRVPATRRGSAHTTRTGKTSRRASRSTKARATRTGKTTRSRSSSTKAHKVRGATKGRKVRKSNKARGTDPSAQEEDHR